MLFVTPKYWPRITVKIGFGTADVTTFQFTGGDRGWKGDVPIVRLNTQRVRGLGWANTLSSKEALRASMVSMLSDAKAGRFDGRETS